MRDLYRPAALIIALMVSLSIVWYVAALSPTARLGATLLIIIAGMVVGMAVDE
jgi:hypothetical protein